MKEIAKICYGSQNYRLEGPDSDYDYKIIMMPEFDDFYNYHKVDKNDLPDSYDPEHHSVMSVLTFDKNLRKGNINAIELLFSSNSSIYDKNFNYYLDMAREAYSAGYVAYVWNSFLATVEGKVKNSIERYGINRKSGSRAIYFIRFCRYVAAHDFKIDKYTWGQELICETARVLRYNEKKELPTKELLFAALENTKQLFTPLEKDMQQWDNFLATTMKVAVRESLRSEL